MCNQSPLEWSVLMCKNTLLSLLELLLLIEDLQSKKIATQLLQKIIILSPNVEDITR